MNADKDPARAAKVAFLTFVIGGVLPVVLKNLWRDMKGDDDDTKWNPERLLLASITNPLTGLPGYSALAGDGGLLSSPSRAKGATKRLAEDVFNGDLKFDLEHVKDVESILQAAALFGEGPAAISAISHLTIDLGSAVVNGAKLVDNLTTNQ